MTPEPQAAQRQEEAVVDAAREWVRVYDAPSSTSTAWANAMQRLRIAVAGVEADRG